METSQRQAAEAERFLPKAWPKQKTGTSHLHSSEPFQGQWDPGVRLRARFRDESQAAFAQYLGNTIRHPFADRLVLFLVFHNGETCLARTWSSG